MISSVYFQIFLGSKKEEVRKAQAFIDAMKQI
jgi:hypothetical protein